MKYGECAVDWTRCGFVLITPDALVRGLVPGMLGRLRDHGYDVRFGKVHWATSLDVDSLYSDHIVRLWETYRFRLVDELLHLGPCLALVLSHRERTGSDMFDHLNALKGKSNPYEAAAGTLRRDFGSINALLSMMHASDDPEEAEREAGIFLAADDEVVGEADLETAAAAWLPLAGGPEERGFDEVLAGFRARVIVAAWASLPQRLRDSFTSTFAAAPATIADPGWADPYADAIEHAGPPGLAAWLSVGFTPESGTIPDLRTARHALVGYGLRLDDWETLVLETSSFFPPRRSSPPA